MRESVRTARDRGPALAVVLAFFGFASAVDAAGPRRGSMPIPPRPANVDSGPIIDGLNKALRALGSTDRDYDGHREKAIAHVAAAIRHLELPNAQGKSSAAVAKAVAGTTPTKGGTTSQDASDASLHKAHKALFAVHHLLADHASTRGRIHADAEVRIAIQELGLAMKSSAAAPAPAPSTSVK